ncbi:ras-related protein Rab-7L1-like isoform X2 [Artemia franciscana]|uniref:ras-related protein Rab-7L1-like isoform X2 n=1 Tax=Artemia franciscana TaxID=6661 RepID=UPI0032DA9DF8
MVGYRSGTESELAESQPLLREHHMHEEVSDFPYEYLVPSEQVFKVIVVGDASVGKTAFVHRYTQQKYDSKQKATIGVDFGLKTLRWSPFHTIKLQLWDIAGQERFAWVTRVYYKEAHGCLVMFDLTRRESFLGAISWKRDIDSKCISSSLPCLLLANKCDLIAQRAVAQIEIEEMSNKEGFTAWTEVSAKNDLMVSDAMRYLVELMLGKSELNSSGSYETAFNDSIKLEKGPLVEKKRKFCFC